LFIVENEKSIEPKVLILTESKLKYLKTESNPNETKPDRVQHWFRNMRQLPYFVSDFKHLLLTLEVLYFRSPTLLHFPLLHSQSTMTCLAEKKG